MNCTEFVSFIKNPSLLKKANAAEIEGLVKEFPYCQSAHLILAKCLHSQNSVYFHNQLKTTAAHLSDRSVLYWLIHGTPEIDVKQDEFLPIAEMVNPVKKAEPEVEADIIISTETLEHNKEIGEYIEVSEDVISESNKDGAPAEIVLPQPEVNIPGIESDTVQETDLIGPVPGIVLPEVQETPIMETPIEPATAEIKDEIKTEPVQEVHIDKPTEHEFSKKISVSENEIIPPETKRQSYLSGQTKIKHEEKDFNYDLYRKLLRRFVFDGIQAEGSELSKFAQVNDLNEEAQSEEMLKSNKELIEKFIREEPRIKPKKEFFNPVNMAHQSGIDSEEIVTETLAKVYEQQGKISRATKIYERLCLIYPEKSAYFAAQIKKLEQIS